MGPRASASTPFGLSLSKAFPSLLPPSNRRGGLRQARPERHWAKAGCLSLLLAGCQQAEAPANQAEAPVVELPKGDVSTAERLVRERLGNPPGLAFADAERSASQGVPIICGAFEQGGARHRYIVVGGQDVFVEPQMEPGEMDRAFAEFCGATASVIPAKAGISGREVAAGLHEAPAYAGVTIQGDRYA